MFDTELNYFIENQSQLVSEHRGKTLVLRGAQVVGIYDDALSAYLESANKYELGTFMIQPCTPGPDAYTVTITSHGIFQAA